MGCRWVEKGKNDLIMVDRYPGNRKDFIYLICNKSEYSTVLNSIIHHQNYIPVYSSLHLNDRPPQTTPKTIAYWPLPSYLGYRILLLPPTIITHTHPQSGESTLTHLPSNILTNC